MSELIETTVYKFEELSVRARETARAWYREGGFDYEWYEFVFEDFGRICECLGVRLKTSPVHLVGGGTRDEPRIHFTGFWSQGDGASFQALYSYRKGAPSAIRDYAPKGTTLHGIADGLQAIQHRNFYQLWADVSHRGNYYHEYCMAISVRRESLNYQDMTADAEDTVIEALRDLARWLYRQLENEYNALTSDEMVDETIEANAYTFTASCRQFG